MLAKTTLQMKLRFSLFLLISTSGMYAQSADRDRLIALGNTYDQFMFMSKPDKKMLSQLRSGAGDLAIANKFVAEAITEKSKILTSTFISLPNETVMKQLFIVFAIHANLRSEHPVATEPLVDSIIGETVSRNELIDNYYTMLFRAVGNKNQPFNLAKIDFDLNAYGLQNETEKAIFFLNCMDFCGSVIWGYINIADPPNTKEALKFIKKFPKFNGQPYYTYNRFFFTDFDMVFVRHEAPESFKQHYLDKYYSTLLSHVVCLIDQKQPDEQVKELMVGSILADDRLWKYTELKETLEQVFKKKE